MKQMNRKPLTSGSWRLAPCLSALLVACLALSARAEPLTLRSDPDLPPRLLMHDKDLALGGPALLRLERPLDDPLRESLKSAGIRLQGYIGRHGYIALPAGRGPGFGARAARHILGRPLPPGTQARPGDILAARG